MIDNLAKEKLKAFIRIEDVIDHLDLRHKLGLKHVGGYLVGKCVAGHESKSGQCCKLGPDWSHLHCFSCNESFDAIELVQREKGLNFVESCQYLAETFRSDLLEELKKSNFSAAAPKQSYALSHLYEMIFQYGKELLFTEKGKEALDYLVKVRGYDPTKLQTTEWVYWPKDAEIRKHLKSKLPKERQEEADSIKLNGNGGDLFRVALPYRDRFGKILGFAKRAAIKEGVADAEGKMHRWSYTAGLKKDDPFNICRCKREKHLILVEGLPDAAYLPSVGIKNIIATGQGDLSVKHIESLKVYEIESIVIVFDNDAKDSKGEIGSIEKAKKAADLLEKNGIKAFILPPHLLSPFKDPDEYVKANGPEAFKKLVEEKALARVRWLPSYFAYKHDLGTDIGRFTALGGVSKAYSQIHDEFERSLFKQEIENTFRLNPAESEGILAKALKEQKVQDAVEKQKQSVEEAQKLLSQGDFLKATQLLSQLNKEGKNDDAYVKPYTIDNLREDLSKIPEGLKTGYKSLDKTVLMPQGAITIVAGRPSHGKTTTLLNFIVNMVKLYPDREFYFFSYEEPKNQILLKILNILAGECVNETSNLSNLEGYVRGGLDKLSKVNEAMTLLQSWTENHRLVVCDHPFFVDDLSREIGRLKERGKLGAVFIDYMQKVKFRGKASSRQLELQKISETILEAAKFYSIPIILGAQLGRGNTKAEVLRMDNIREAGDIENDSKVILGIWNEAKEAADTKGMPLSRMVDFDLVVLKNRNGLSNHTVSLTFDRPLSTLKEKS